MVQNPPADAGDARDAGSIPGSGRFPGGRNSESILRGVRLDGHEFEQALGVGDGQGSLVCCSPWGTKSE